jgi:hypothetical protein
VPADVAAPLGEYFATMAHLEAASVHAFERLREELAAHSAPASLLRVAGRSARDEVRHARITAQLAHRFGAQTEAPRVRTKAVRSLARVAHENAIEGCVRETFGAMVATWQATHAEDEGVRRAMGRIAVDETRHAALAWAIARWAEPRLDARARARIRKAQRAAIERLTADVAHALPTAARREAGIPSTAEARALLGTMAEIWA